MDAAQVLVSIMVYGGGGAALATLVTGLVRWLSGSASRERIRNADIERQRLVAIEERASAEKQRDEADRKRRIAYEYASTLRSQLLEHGIQPEALPEDLTVPRTAVKQIREKADDKLN